MKTTHHDFVLDLWDKSRKAADDLEEFCNGEPITPAAARRAVAQTRAASCAALKLERAVVGIPDPPSGD